MECVDVQFHGVTLIRPYSSDLESCSGYVWENVGCRRWKLLRVNDWVMKMCWIYGLLQLTIICKKIWITV